MTDWNAAESGDLPGRCKGLQIASLAGPAFFFLALGRIDAALRTPFGWAVNLFPALPSDASCDDG